MPLASYRLRASACFTPPRSTRRSKPTRSSTLSRTFSRILATISPTMRMTRNATNFGTKARTFAHAVEDAAADVQALQRRIGHSSSTRHVHVPMAAVVLYAVWMFAQPPAPVVLAGQPSGLRTGPQRAPLTARDGVTRGPELAPRAVRSPGPDDQDAILARLKFMASRTSTTTPGSPTRDP